MASHLLGHGKPYAEFAMISLITTALVRLSETALVSLIFLAFS